MKSNVKTTKSAKFSELILMPENIRELAKIVFDEYDQDMQKGDEVLIQFFLEDIHHIQRELRDLKDFLEKGTLESNRILSIHMSFLNFDENKRISIYLKHRRFVEIITSGKDENWVFGVLEMIEICLLNCRKQKIWPHKYRWLLTAAFSFGIGLLFIKLFEIIISRRLADIFPIFSNSLFRLYSQFALGFIPASLIVDEIRKLYPRVELITGPEHTRPEERKKEILQRLVSLVVITLVVSILIELLKAIFDFSFQP